MDCEFLAERPICVDTGFGYSWYPEECNIPICGGDHQDIVLWEKLAAQKATSSIPPRSNLNTLLTGRIEPIQLPLSKFTSLLYLDS